MSSRAVGWDLGLLTLEALGWDLGPETLETLGMTLSVEALGCLSFQSVAGMVGRLDWLHFKRVDGMFRNSVCTSPLSQKMLYAKKERTRIGERLVHMLAYTTKLALARPPVHIHVYTKHTRY